MVSTSTAATKTNRVAAEPVNITSTDEPQKKHLRRKVSVVTPIVLPALHDPGGIQEVMDHDEVFTMLSLLPPLNHSCDQCRFLVA